MPPLNENDEHGYDVPLSSLSRRSFLKLVGAGAALGCAQRPARSLVPYGETPPELVPGVAQHYATSMVLDGLATGLVVTSHEGRPTKIEGNPDHPTGIGGGTSAQAQAAILDLYDPRRAAAVLRDGAPSSFAALAAALAEATPPGGEGVRFLLDPTSSPLEIALLSRLRARLPAARVTFFSSGSRPHALAGARLALGRPLAAERDLGRADVVVSLGADFLGQGPTLARDARAFATRRRAAGGMSRLWVAESALSPTGSLADHRLRARPSEMFDLAAALLAALRPGVIHAPPPPDWARAAAADLARARGRACVLVGEELPAAVHALGHMIDAALGAVGETVRYHEPAVFEAGGATHDLAVLARELHEGSVRVLIMLGWNPVYAAPADLGFAEGLSRVPLSVYLGPYLDETALLSRWLIPARHFLESWGDARAHDGTLSFIQPLVEPLSAAALRPADVLALFDPDSAGLEDPQNPQNLQNLQNPQNFQNLLKVPNAPNPRNLQNPQNFQDLLKVQNAPNPQNLQNLQNFQNFLKVQNAPNLHLFQKFQMLQNFQNFLKVQNLPNVAWEAALQRGFLAGSALPTVEAAADPAAAGGLPRPAQSPAGSIEIRLVPDAKVHDGRFANNAWLQELPAPMTQLTWDNAALLSPRTARELGVGDGDHLELSLAGRGLRAPALVQPGHADDTITLALGYGRAGAEELAAGVGVNAGLLATAALPAGGPGRARAVPGHTPLALSQHHLSAEERPLALTATVAEAAAAAARQRGPQPSLLADHYTPQRREQWAMTIDLAVCTGCASCVVACQAENNIPCVGKDGVRKSRQMHWLRIDRYLAGPADDPTAVSQPMLCQHCEKAPCEYVCPVNATVHSDDGLNEMVYNRCIGTRFCSNNCPYKARRFNFFSYVRRDRTALQKNPAVTVRQRGVMEKCTYCVQRIRGAEIDARIAGRELGGDDVVTACQQACPTGAIVFGSLHDPAAAVARLREDPRAYEVLHDLGTRPRTRYLVKLTNPAPNGDER